MAEIMHFKSGIQTEQPRGGATTEKTLSQEVDSVFIAGEIAYEDSDMPSARKAFWDDPVVAEFVQTGKRPEWDVEAFIQKNFPKKPSIR